jgi:hypothetical protein
MSKTVSKIIISKSLLKLTCFIIFVLLAIGSEAAPKQHKVTVGMFNTYSSGDGNLGRAEPDLKEVWEGLTGVSDYEACNMTMHYWPRPTDLPVVTAGQNPYAAWWKDYMEEAYNLTNQNGEVRLKVIVGPLYSYYLAYKGEDFNEFIRDLCLWEKDSVYSGTLDGWYLVEEPMGSSHNFDPDINNEMAEAIKSVEKSLGVEHHKIYVDVSLDGYYYSSSSLAAFTRTADVVMISSSSYLWITSGKQPVFEPRWIGIHSAMRRLRDVVYRDRDRRKLPRPEVHVVLEGSDSTGHGQPTNWEMKQQIHTTLSQSLFYNDAPADGVWFFWWSQIARNKKDDADDWNYGRRVAEAIQTQVPRSTFAVSPWIKKEVDPDKTQFAFPEIGSFNPSSSCIPYDLAEPGNVRVEVLNENMSLAKEFDMKYQVAGEIRKFGGPYWRRAGASNGYYIFRLYLNSKLVDEKRVKAQWSVIVNSTSHKIGMWSNNNIVEVQWEPQAETEEGLNGYSVLWDTSRYGSPDSQLDLPSEVTGMKSDPLPDGDSNYFHISTLNGAGTWSTSTHLGPFYIDTAQPGNVKDLTSNSHDLGEWSKDNRVIVRWNPAEDAASGVAGYSILWDANPGVLPDDKVDISHETTLVASEPLNNGEYYFHIRAVDNAGNWSDTAAHTGPFLIDSSPPGSVAELISDSHISGQWSNNHSIVVKWENAEDAGSGIGGYSIIWDSSADTVPDESVNISSWITSSKSPLLESQTYYFHIRSADKAGNWSQTAHLGPFYIDTKEPDNVKIQPESHKVDEWSKINSVTVKWDPAEDDSSGVKGYSVLWSHKPGDIPDNKINLSADVIELTSEPLDDGKNYLHIRSADKAGNWNSSAAHLGPFLIDTTPPTSVKMLMSGSHVAGQWSNNEAIEINWQPPEDATSGIKGYSILWDYSANTLPDESMDIASVTSITSPPLESSSEQFYYFHIRGVDQADNWSEQAKHLGPFMIDAEPPLKISHLVSTSHDPDKWSPLKSVSLSWTPTEDRISGISGYEWNISQTQSVSEIWNATNQAFGKGLSEMGKTGASAPVNPNLYIPNLDDGIWDISVRAIDNAQNTGDSNSITLKIDSTPPVITDLSSPSHSQSNTWYIDPQINLRWRAKDDTSGVDGYNWSWDMQENTAPDITESVKNESIQIAATSSGVWYFHLRAADQAGNWSETSHYRIQIDPSSPTAPYIGSHTHPNGQWTARSHVGLSWEIPVPVASGVEGYSYKLDGIPLTIPDEITDEGIGQIEYRDLADGIWYFHCRAKSGSGLWGATAHYEIRIDNIPPVISITHPQDGKWYRETITEYYGTAEDYASGINLSTYQYSLNGGSWTSFQSDTPENWIDQDQIPNIDQTDGDTLRVRVRDNAGNLGISHPIVMKVDRFTQPPVIVSSTHPDQDKWYSRNSPDFAWSFDDQISGASAYSWALDNSENTIPPQIGMIEGNNTFKTDIRALSDGIWYFHLRGQDKAGNWSETSHFRIRIDSTPPTAKLSLTGPAVSNNNPAIVRSGPVRVLLQSSESITKPTLEYNPKSASYPIPIELSGSEDEWRGEFSVTIHTGDGEANFLFAAMDEAGNMGNEINAGNSFVIDTLIRADMDKTQDVLCVNEPDTKLIISPGSIKEDIRFEILKDTSALEPRIIGIYDLVAYNPQMSRIDKLIFKTSAEIIFSLSNQANANSPISVYYWDRVKWHKVQDSWTTVRIDHTGRFALIESEPMRSSVAQGWAAPNPFTPNGSGDATDRTVFYVATRYKSTDFTVKIYNVNGRRIKILENGRRIWDGTDEHGNMVEGGLYIYQIHSGDEIISGTVVVIR